MDCDFLRSGTYLTLIKYLHVALAVSNINKTHTIIEFIIFSCIVLVHDLTVLCWSCIFVMQSTKAILWHKCKIMLGRHVLIIP